MKLSTILHHTPPTPDATPEFIREIVDIRGVRVVRLQGSVGREIGGQAEAAQDAAAKLEGVFARPLLFDFKDTTNCDTATVAYLVRALRQRMAAHAQVGIINAPPKLLAELNIARIEDLFRVFATEAEALDELSGHP